MRRKRLIAAVVLALAGCATADPAASPAAVAAALADALGRANEPARRALSH